LKMPIVPCLERIAKKGYSGIDVSGTNGPSADPKSFDKARRKLTRETAERLELRVEAIITHAQLTDTLANPKQPTLDLRGSIDLASDLGGDVVTFHMGGYHDGLEKSKQWDRAVGVIRDAAEYGMGKHVGLAVDGIWPTWIDDSMDALAKLFRDVGSDNFGVNFDPCYLTLMGLDPVKFARRFSKRILHAHLKDHRGKYPKWKHLLPGKGEMDYGRVFAALKTIGFKGSASVECFVDMKFETACDDCFDAMTKAARQGRVRFKDS